MTRHALIVLMLAMGWCSRIQTASYGGPNEEALVAATLAHDAVRVQQLLTAGADPNKAITHAGQSQSAWSLALERFNPKQDRQAQIDIVQAMLKSGADPDAAWGTNGGDVPQTLTSVGRRSFSLRFPIDLAMYSGDAAIVEAILRVETNGRRRRVGVGDRDRTQGERCRALADRCRGRCERALWSPHSAPGGDRSARRGDDDLPRTARRARKPVAVPALGVPSQMAVVPRRCN